MKNIFGFLLTWICTILSAADITLAENGETKASIVIPENAKPIVKFAAQELADHLKKMTGAKFAIGTVSGPHANFYLGFGDAEKFSPDEFVISAQKNRIDIYGKDTSKKMDMHDYFFNNREKGTLRGVYNFLDSLGIRWLAPGDDGVFVPVCRTLRIPEQEIRFKPKLPERRMVDTFTFQRYPDAKEYVKGVWPLYLWGIRNNISARNMVVGCHSERSLRLYNNPEWLKHTSAHQLMKNGKRNPDYSCWTDPYTKEVWLRVVDGYFSGKSPKECGLQFKKWLTPFIVPDEFLIDPMDYSGNNDGRCWCDRCQEFRKKHPCEDDTEIIWQVLSEIAEFVAKKYPGRYISTLIYPPKTLIPETIRKPKNIRVRVCMPGARSLLYPNRLQKEMERLRGWGNFLGPKNVPLWIYQCQASFGNYMPGVPDIYPHLTAKFIRTVEPFCAGMFYENHNVTHTFRNLDVYIYMRMIWNPDRDIEKELDEYYKLYYGPAAIPAKELFTRLENGWIKLDPIIFSNEKQSDLGGVRKDKHAAQKIAWSTAFDSAEMKRIDDVAKEIVRLSPAGTVYAKRAGLLQKYLVQVMKNERNLVMQREDIINSLKVHALHSSAVNFPSEQEWNNAPQYNLVSAQRMRNIKVRGSFRMLASENMLFIRANLDEPEIANSKTDSSRKTGSSDVWRDNCIELFFYAKKSRKFWQIIVNDNGVWSSQTRGRVLLRWEQMKGLKLKTRQKANRWTAEIAIPLSELKTDRTDLRFNLTRERNIKGQPTEYSTWSPLATISGWHSPDNYGTAVFEQ